MKIKRNRLRCKKCKTVIESTYGHDFKWCPCGSCFIDGGTAYVRYGGDMNQIELLTEMEKKSTT